MKFLQQVSFLLLASCLAMGQAPSPAADDPNSVAAEIKALREALAAQQQQIAQQQQQIEKLQKQTAAPQQESSSADSGRLVNASLNTNNPVNVAARPLQADKPKESPLSFKIGAADFTPGGFVDFENVFRSTNTGFVTATNFWAIPFSNTVQGHLTEYRSTGQYSRFNIKTHAKYGQNDITGYVEFDLQSPNRAGLSPNPSDIFTTLGEDAQTHVGVNYTRAAEFRATYHFNDNWQWAVALQNPQQFVGQGAEVVFPSAFNAALGVQVDAANNIGTPNVAPDILTKFAYDKSFSGRQFHFELGGLMTTAKVTAIPRGGTTFSSHSTVGGGINGGINADLWKGSDNRNINFVAYGMWGYGVGRYLIGTGPQFVVAPVTTSGGATPCTSTGSGAGIVVTGNCDIAISGVHSGDFVGGVEFRPHAKAQFGAYYGGTYFQRNFFRDLTGGAAQPFIGFGGPNSSNIANRAIQEASLDWTQTFWKNPQYGAVLLVTQASYVTRSAWFVAAGAPKNAHLGMGYVSLRYVLP